AEVETNSSARCSRRRLRSKRLALAQIASSTADRIAGPLRRAIVVVAALLGGANGELAAAATPAEPPYPVRPIRVIVPQASGGTADLLTRMLGERMEAMLGAGFVVDNKPGASGIAGNDAAKRAPPDGYTLLAASTATHTMTPHVVANLPYDPLQDFVP